ncbi:MAG: hypothetical protein IJ775_00305 [Muribaculaceae bacterium]|nr:hypothetical protein [Muribaculaceae bacterium]
MRWWHLITLAVVMALTSCRGDRMSDHVITQNEAFTLTGDSLIEGGIVATAATPLHIESSLTHERLDSMALAYARLSGNEGMQPAFVGGRPWHSQGVNSHYQQFDAPQHLLVALHNMSVDHIAAASTGTTFDAHGDTIGLYCAIYLSLAHLDPARSRATLRALAPGGVIAPCGESPANASRLAWTTAAWEVYVATGDRSWLQFLHTVVDNTLRQDCRLLQDFDYDLMHGGAGQRPLEFYPTWMQSIDIIASMPLCTNVLVMRALEIMGEVDEELGFTHDHAANAQRLKAAINQHLWSERAGRYSAYLYGSVTPLRAPIVDNLAQSLAVMWNIADDDRASTLIQKTPINHRGIPVIYPWAAPVEPYFSHPTWPAIQALWTLAAVSVDNEDMARRGMAALFRAQALFQSRHITTAQFRPNDLLCSASNQAIMLRVLAGLKFLPDGLEISPFIPASMPGTKVLKNFRYRHMSLDITITGTGNDVKEITLDGNPLESSFLPATITGHHLVQVTMQQGNSTSGVTITKGNVAMPPTPDVVWTPDSGCIVNFVAAGRYMMMMNGRFTVTLSDMAFALPGKTAEVSVAMANKYGFGFIARPLMIHRDPIEKSLSGLMHADSTEITISVPQAGAYLLQIDYTSTGRGPCDALLVDVNTHPQGAVFMPIEPETSGSNWLHVSLLRGDNHFLFVRPRTIDQSVTPTVLRLVKR